MKKKATLRAIDQGTLYDIPGKLIKLGRTVRSGKLGPITEALIVLKKEAGDYEIYGIGRGDPAQQHLMATIAASRILSTREAR